MPFILKDPLRKNRVFSFDMSVRKVLQMRNALFFEYSVQGLRRQPQSYSKRSTRNEYATVDVSRHRAENVSEFQRMSGGEPRTRLLEQFRQFFEIVALHRNLLHSGKWRPSGFVARRNIQSSDNEIWRRGWDSNPREENSPTRFPGAPVRPLQHLSVSQPASRLPAGHLSSENSHWRRGWDSNPRGLAPYRFSRTAPSATRTPLRYNSSGNLQLRAIHGRADLNSTRLTKPAQSRSIDSPAANGQARVETDWRAARILLEHTLRGVSEAGVGRTGGHLQGEPAGTRRRTRVTFGVDVWGERAGFPLKEYRASTRG